MPNPMRGYLRDGQSPLKCHASKNAELVAGVLTINVKGRVGFGVTRLLRFAEGLVELNAARFHLGEDVVGRTIQNSVHRSQAIAGRGFMDHTKDGDATS